MLRRTLLVRVDRAPGRLPSCRCRVRHGLSAMPLTCMSAGPPSPSDASTRAERSRPCTLHPLLAPRTPVTRHRDPPWESASRWNRCRICPGSHGFSSDVRDGHCACGGMAGSALLAPVTASARGGKPRCSWVCQPGVGTGVSAPGLGPRPGGRRRGPAPQAAVGVFWRNCLKSGGSATVSWDVTCSC